MKVVRLFIASSIEEFKNERIFIGDFIRKLNDRSRALGYQIRLFLCEDESNNCQSIYDREIENSDIFIALVGSFLRPFTNREIAEARDSSIIKKRVIIYNSPSSEILVPEELRIHFENLTYNIHFLEHIYDYIEKVTQSLIPYIEDKTILPSVISRLAIPCIADTLETAIIGNIIRGFNDQHESELIIDANEFIIASNYDAYITLLSDGLDSEISRTQALLDANTAMEILWVFSNRNIQNPKINGIIASLKERLKFTERYETYDELALKFKCLLLTKALNMIVGMKIFDQFEYIIEDHLLKRSLKTGDKYIIKNLASISNDPETQRRKENTIKNLLNFYHNTEQKFDKYKEALKALQDSNYSFFVYESSEDVKNLPIKQNEAYQVVIDYVIDRLESLHKKVALLLDNDIKDEINKIFIFLKDSRFLVDAKDEFLIDYEIGTILFDNCGSLNDETEMYLEKALQVYQTMQSSTTTQENDKAMKCVLHLCEIKEIKNKEEDWKNWIDYGLKSIEEIKANNSDYTSSFNLHDCGYMLYVYKARFARKDDLEKSEEYYDKALKELEGFDYNKDNYTLHRYIQLKYETLINALMLDRNIEECEKEVATLFDNYKKYLSFSNDYLIEKSYLLILKAYLKKEPTLWEEAVRIIVNNSLLRGHDQIFLDILYIGSEMFKKMNLYREAIQLLSELIIRYPGDIDKAICLKSRGACYEDLLDEKGSLNQAEKDFKESIKLFKSKKKKKYLGFVLDDLAFCLILQKKYDKAEVYAQKAIAVKEYKAYNKYCNYISSLMCQPKRFSEAKKYYNSFCQEDREKIKEVLLKDWGPDDYMSRVGIDTKKFHKLFSMQKNTLPRPIP